MNKYLNLLMLLLIIGSLFAHILYATTDVINLPNDGNDNQGGGNEPFCSEVTASSSSSTGGTIYVGVNVENVGSGSNTISTGLYTDSGGAPHTLLGNSLFVNPTLLINNLAIQQTVSIASTTNYWLCYASTSGTIRFYVASGGAGDYGSTSSPWPNPFVSGGSLGEGLNMQLVYSSTTTSTTTSTTSTSTSTTSTTTSSTTTTAGTTTFAPIVYGNGLYIGNNPANLVLDTFAIPLMAYFFMILGWWIIYIRTKNISLAFLWTALISYALYYISPTSTNAWVGGFLTVCYVLTFGYQLTRNRQKAGGYGGGASGLMAGLPINSTS